MPTPSFSYATYRPSGDQIGFLLVGGPNVSRVATPCANSTTHVSPSRSLASRVPSGEIIATSPASGIAPRFLPSRSRHTYCQPLAWPDTYASRPWLDAVT